MARTKAIPLRREPSGFDQGNSDNPTPGRTHMRKAANGNAVLTTLSNGKLPGSSRSSSQEQAGLAQLIICIAGIYASL